MLIDDLPVRVVEAGAAGGSKPDGHEAFIVGMIEAQKDIALNEMVERLKHAQPMAAAARMDIQKKTAHALEQEREDILKRRRDWFDG